LRSGERDAKNPDNEESVMPAIPVDYLDLLQQKKAFANLATLMPDGTPQVTPVWFDYTGRKIRINSAKGRVKVRNMQEGAPVALSILDPDNPYRYIQIRGRVQHLTEEGASAHIDALAKKYLGKDKYPYARPGEVRVTFEIEPAAVRAQGCTRVVLMNGLASVVALRSLASDERCSPPVDHDARG
jgi:PPOX class probable F420-dependent enzyme